MNFQPKLKEVEMKNMVKNICAAMVINLCAAGHLSATENNPNNDNKFMEENLNLTQEWDKTFPQSDKVDHKKITFHNRYGITLAADLYVPKNVTGKLPAIAISGPFGAVKEQASGLYAQTLAERGFLTIAFDPSYTGESSGQPRYVASPDINTEDFSAAVDYLSTRDDVDSDRIGIIGNSKLIIDDTPGISIAEMRSKCRKYKLEHDLKLIIIDYLQLMSGSGKGSDSRQQEISDISRSLKALARELSVPVIALSQLSRAVEQRPDHRPMLSDLRESGAIEQDADVVMFIYRDDYYNHDSEMKGISEIIIAKQRNGPIGTVNLVWLPQYTKFANMEKN